MSDDPPVPTVFGREAQLRQPLGRFWSEFPDEVSCVGYFKAFRWPYGPVCPYCGHNRIYGPSKAGVHICARCERTFSFKVGTLLHGTRLPIRTWFAAIWMLTTSSRGVTSVRLARDFGLPQYTAWTLLRRLRHATATPAFNRPLRDATAHAEASRPISVTQAAPTARGRYDGKLKLAMSFDEAIERFAAVEFRELRDSLRRSPRKRPPRDLSLKRGPMVSGIKTDARDRVE